MIMLLRTAVISDEFERSMLDLKGDDPGLLHWQGARAEGEWPAVSWGEPGVSPPPGRGAGWRPAGIPPKWPSVGTALGQGGVSVGSSCHTRPSNNKGRRSLARVPSLMPEAYLTTALT